MKTDIYFFIKLLSAVKKKEPEAPPIPPVPSNEELLLSEIRDLLKAKQL